LDHFELEDSSLGTMAGRRVFHEEIEVQREPDRLHSEAG
jgi:hypothetical protein